MFVVTWRCYWEAFRILGHMLSFFKTCKARFSLREESYKVLQWENPKKRGNKKVTPETKKEQNPHHQHKTTREAKVPHGQPKSAQGNTEKTPTSPLAKQLVGSTEVKVPQDNAFRKGATRTPSSSAYPQRGRSGLHLANQGVWRPR
jgi:hypothetical protein